MPLRAFAVLALLLASWPVNAQGVPPSQVTPPTLRLPAPAPEQPTLLPPQSPEASSDTDLMTVQVGRIVVREGFAVLTAQTQLLLAPYMRRRITGSEVLQLSASIEQAYASHGFILARVVVPPQQVTDGDVLYLQVVDGFVQDVDLEQVPAPMREVVRRRVRPLVGRHRVRLSTLERQVLLAGDVSGLSLHSTLVPGTEEGGTILVLTGSYQRISGNLAADNRLDRALGPWEVNGSVAVNSLLGQGEEFYGYGSTADPQHLWRADTPLRVYGGGLVVPLGGEGVTLNLEYTHSATHTAAVQQVPSTEGLFERMTLRAALPVRWTRQGVTKVNFTAEDIVQELTAPLFGAFLNRDRYRVLRMGFDNEALSADGSRLAIDATLSHGIGGRNAADALVSGVPLSRAGAGPDFNKISTAAHYAQPLPVGLRVNLTALAQVAFGQPQLRSEQFSLDGIEAFSPFAPGSLSVDQGATLRAELIRPVSLDLRQENVSLAPYLLGAVGRGANSRPTALEVRSVTANSFGAGVRAAFGGLDNADLGLEVARQQSNVPGLKDEWRGTVTLSVRL